MASKIPFLQPFMMSDSCTQLIQQPYSADTIKNMQLNNSTSKLNRNRF